MKKKDLYKFPDITQGLSKSAALQMLKDGDSKGKPLTEKQKVFFSQRTNMQNGGWLDQYNNGGTLQEHQENYNISSVTIPPNFVGMSNDTSGRNYSGSWGGGSFQDGGNLKVEKVPSKENINVDTVDVLRDTMIKRLAGVPIKYGNQYENFAITPSDKLFSPTQKEIKDWLIARKNKRGFKDTPNEMFDNQILNLASVKTQDMLSATIKNAEDENLSIPKTLGNIWENFSATLGRYYPTQHTQYSSPLFFGDKTDVKRHENTHALNAFRQEEQIDKILKEQTYTPKSFGRNVPIKGITDSNSYYDNPGEIYSRMMEYRLKNKLNPSKNITKEDLINIRNNKDFKDNHFDKRYDDDTKLRLLNEIVDNKQQTPKQYPNIPIAQNGGEMKFYQEGRDFTPKIISQNGSRIPSQKERLQRQALAESNWQEGNVQSNAGALGPLQIMPDAYKDYQEATGDKSDYTSVKQFPKAISVRNWLMDNIANAEFIKDKPQTEDVRLAKIYAAYNYGKGNLLNYLNTSKSKGVDIYNSLDWTKNLPKETQNYLNKILFKNSSQFERDFKDALKNNPNKKYFKKEGGVIKDNNGYWNPNNWGKPVEIDSNNITMQGINQPLLGISDVGDSKTMLPGKEYKFKGKKVVEYPIVKNGKQLQLLDDLTNFSNYNNSSKNWLEKYK